MTGRGPFPKSSRILRSSDFRKVYSEGFKVSGRVLTAFCLSSDQDDGPRVGFTVPRAVGKAVVRNRIKRRLREAVRLQIHDALDPRWHVVFNPRRTALDAPFEELLKEVRKVLDRCAAS